MFILTLPVQNIKLRYMIGKNEQSGSSSHLGINAQHFIVDKYLIFNNITYYIFWRSDGCFVS